MNNGERTSMSRNTRLLKTEREFGKMIMIIILLFVGTYFPSFLLRAVGSYFTNMHSPRVYVYKMPGFTTSNRIRHYVSGGSSCVKNQNTCIRSISVNKLFSRNHWPYRLYHVPQEIPQGYRCNNLEHIKQIFGIRAHKYHWINTWKFL